MRPALTGNRSMPNSPAPHGKSRNAHDNEGREDRRRRLPGAMCAIEAAEGAGMVWPIIYGNTYALVNCRKDWLSGENGAG
jgi:hypothetical protein